MEGLLRRGAGNVDVATTAHLVLVPLATRATSLLWRAVLPHSLEMTLVGSGHFLDDLMCLANAFRVVWLEAHSDHELRPAAVDLYELALMRGK